MSVSTHDLMGVHWQGKNLGLPADIFRNSCLLLRCVFQTNHLYSHAVFLPSFLVYLFHYKRKCTSIDYSRSPRHSRFFATPFAGIISGLGIICGPVWGSFAVLGSFAGRDHSRACTYSCETVQRNPPAKYIFSIGHVVFPWLPGFLDSRRKTWRENQKQKVRTEHGHTESYLHWPFGKHSNKLLYRNAPKNFISTKNRINLFPRVLTPCCSDVNLNWVFLGNQWCALLWVAGQMLTPPIDVRDF